jgi:hypothetical protein
MIVGGHSCAALEWACHIAMCVRMPHSCTPPTKGIAPRGALDHAPISLLSNYLARFETKGFYTSASSYLPTLRSKSGKLLPILS